MDRKFIIGQIESDENKRRKALSYNQFQIYNDNLQPFVLRKLQSMYNADTINEMPVISSINILRRIVNQEASIYRHAPIRNFVGLSDAQMIAVENIYDDLFINKKMMISNRYYKLQFQNILYCRPKNGRLVLDPVKMHHIDAIPNSLDVRDANTYILSNFDRQYYTDITSRFQSEAGSSRGNLYSDGVTMKISDSDDYKKMAQRYTVWTKEENYIMDGMGSIISEGSIDSGASMMSSFEGDLPFVDISFDKDDSFFIFTPNATVDFCIDYNASISSFEHIVNMQGFSIAVLKGPKELLPKSVTIGPSKVLQLEIDPNNPVEVDFSFVSPSPDLAGTKDFMNLKLNSFLSSKGLDPRILSTEGTGQAFNSGEERLLYMIEKFEATRDDFSVYEMAEKELFRKIVKWHNDLIDDDQLLPKYKASQRIDDEAFLEIEFQRPEMSKTDEMLLNEAERRMELGVSSLVDEIQEMKGLSREQAVDYLQRINEDRQFIMGLNE